MVVLVTPWEVQEENTEAINKKPLLWKVFITFSTCNNGNVLLDTTNKDLGNVEYCYRFYLCRFIKMTQHCIQLHLSSC